jgi:hypothetical protein
MRGNRLNYLLLHRLMGATFILFLVIGFAVVRNQLTTGTHRNWTWSGYLFTSQTTQSIRLPANSSIRVGDPLFLELETGQFEFAGDVFQVTSNSTGEKLVQIYWRNGHVLPEQPRVEYYETPRSLVWIARTLLPPEKKKRVIDKIMLHYQQEAPKINAKLMPVLREVFQRSIPIIEEAALEYVKKERTRVQGLGQKYQETLVKQKLVPLLRRDVMPIVEKHSKPVVEDIGLELWDRASLWRFGWRYAYDVLPLTNRNLVQAEWRRFVEEEAIPVLESHFDEFIEVQKRILVETSSNPAVRKAIQESMGTLIDDPELQDFLGDVLQHAVVNNQKLHSVLQEVMSSEQAMQLGRQFEESLQPLANEIGVELFGTETEGLTPELVAVLRSQILGKDQRWLIVRNHVGSQNPPSAVDSAWVGVLGEDVPLFPFQNADLLLKPKNVAADGAVP